MRSIVFTLALLAGTAATVPATAGEPKGRVKSDPPDARLDRELAAIQTFAEQFTGLTFKTDVLVNRLSADEYKANRAKKYTDTKASRQREWRILLALGLIEDVNTAEELY